MVYKLKADKGLGQTPASTPVGTSNHLNPTELRRAIGNIWRPDVKDDQTARQVTDAPNATSGDVWEDDKLSTTEDDTPQPDHSTKMDIPTSSGYNKLSTTEGGSPNPTQLAANDPVNPDVPAAGITNPNGPVKDPQPPVIPWPVDDPPIPIYTLSSPPPPVSYTLEDFLKDCPISANNQHTQMILQRHQINQWTHLKKSDEAELIDMGLDKGLACALCEGERACRNHY
ncbi:hypothetical protein PCASD_06864 [Puccinia coronata f. sp. avenae]|uniref:Uncharacterized protein n=1 Tax=Puccinia coronata f. sp. avenae TaxID=200324 RepID=A0A2N5UYH3_9BASI|nr:hypothetical protein PCASD_06864 [Puccinia coronata f. sp. avenae]